MVGFHNVINQGRDAEEFVFQEFKRLGIEPTFTTRNDNGSKYYDFWFVGKDRRKVRVEIKSCRLIIYNGKGRQQFGRFDFTDPKSIKRQRYKNVYICFVVSVEDRFQILGFMSALSVKKKFVSGRYIDLKKIMFSRLTKFSQFIKKWD